MLRFVTLALLAALAVGAAGCRSHAANRLEVGPGEGNYDLKIVNPGLQAEAEITGAKAYYEADILAALVYVESHVDDKVRMEYRWKWHDGMDYNEGDTAWRSLFLNPLDETQIQGRAPAPNMEKGRFELRYPLSVEGSITAD